MCNLIENQKIFPINLNKFRFQVGHGQQRKQGEQQTNQCNKKKKTILRPKSDESKAQIKQKCKLNVGQFQKQNRIFNKDKRTMFDYNRIDQ